MAQPPQRNLPPDSTQWAKWVERQIAGLDSDSKDNKRRISRVQSSQQHALSDITNVRLDQETNWDIWELEREAIVNNIEEQLNDPQQPIVPEITSITTEAYWDEGGQPRANATVKWLQVYYAEDESLLLDITNYEVAMDGLIEYVPGIEIEEEYEEGEEPDVENSVVLENLPASTELSVRIRAVGVLGGVSEWSEPFVFVTDGLPLELLPPSTPTFRTENGAVEIIWDGRLNNNEVPPTYFSHCLVQSRKQGTSTWIDYGQDAGWVLTGLTAGDVYEARLIAVDTLGRESEPSAIGSVTVKSAVKDAMDLANQTAADLLTEKDRIQTALEDAFEAKDGVQGALNDIQTLDHRLTGELNKAREDVDQANEDATQALQWAAKNLKNLDVFYTITSVSGGLGVALDGTSWPVAREDQTPTNLTVESGVPIFREGANTHWIQLDAAEELWCVPRGLSDPPITPTGMEPTPEWSNAEPLWAPNSQVWWSQRTVSSDGTVSWSPPVRMTAFDVAADALMKANSAVSGTTLKYAVGTAIEPTGAWQSTPPTIPTDGYMWQQTTVTYGSGETEVLDPIRVTGNQGKEGVGIEGLVPYWRYVNAGAAAPAKPTTKVASGWSTSEPAADTTKDLYRVERIDYTDGSWQWTSVQKVASFQVAKDAMTVAANLRSVVEAGLMRFAKESEPPAPFKGGVWAVLDEVTGSKTVGLRQANSAGTAWVPYQIIVEDLMVVGTGGTIQLKDNVVTAGTIQATNNMKAKFAQIIDLEANTAAFNAAVIKQAFVREMVGTKWFVETFSAEKISVSGTNLLQNINFQAGWHRDGSTAAVVFAPINGPGGAPALMADAGTSTSYAGYYGNEQEYRIPCDGAEQFVFGGWFYFPDSAYNGTGVSLRRQRWTADGVRSMASTNLPAAPQNTWTYLEVSFANDADTREFGIYIGASSAYTDRFYVANPAVRRKVSSILIEDNAITSPKIKAKSIEFEHMNGGALDAFQITSPLIQSVSTAKRGIKWNGSTLIGYTSAGAEAFRLDGTRATITAGTIQTAPSGGARVVLDADGLKAYNASGTQTASILGATGAVTGWTLSSPTVTGGTIQTATSGQRIVIDSTGLKAYNTSNAVTASILSGVGSFTGATMSAPTITGGTVTGATLQTIATAKRGVKITSAGIQGWNSSGTQTFSVSASTGAVTVSNGTITGSLLESKNSTNSVLIGPKNRNLSSPGTNHGVYLSSSGGTGELSVENGWPKFFMALTGAEVEIAHETVGGAGSLTHPLLKMKTSGGGLSTPYQIEISPYYVTARLDGGVYKSVPWGDVLAAGEALTYSGMQAIGAVTSQAAVTKTISVPPVTSSTHLPQLTVRGPEGVADRLTVGITNWVAGTLTVVVKNHTQGNAPSGGYVYWAMLPRNGY